MHAEPPNAIELDIIRSFGWSIVELEETLYERFLHLSAARSLVPRDTFQSHLREMEAKGFISPVRLHGMKGYKRLLADKDLGKSVYPNVPLDEIRLALGSVKARPALEKARASTRVSEDLFSSSESVGVAIQAALENCMLRETGRISKGAVHEHMKNMCQALSKSEEDLFEYIRDQTPGILIEVGQILRSHGPDFLLLSLRLTEANIRKYSY
ncbi:MAG: hypothetical protein C4K48_02580 [Candidatus Thorarchaeota archaeon]|nr:MAG: hypothetical protein C4K48_02580 [Candidatus Thorarchaeota archaeon]